MKKDDFFLHYQYDHKLSARLKNRRARRLHYWKILLIFSAAALAIPLLFGRIDLSAIIFLIVFVIFLFCATVYIFTHTMIRPRCKKCGKRMLKKYILYGYGGEQLYFPRPDCRIYSEAYTCRD